MVDGGANVCVTGDIESLLDVTDIDPISISVAIEGSASSFDDCITKWGVFPLSLSDGTTYFQTCYYCANMVETIISPAAVLTSSDVFFSWTQEGFYNPTIPGSLRFTSHDGLLSMHFPLRYHDGLYYCDTDVYTRNSAAANRKNANGSRVAALACLGWLGQPLTLFSLFGLLLITAIGVDYAILMRENIGGPAVSLLGTLLSALTSWLSFGLLLISDTPAIANFGLAISLGLLFCFLLAPWAGTRQSTANQAQTL